MRIASDIELTALIGVAAGMRTTAPVVAMADDPGKAWCALSGELLVDKLPFTPARTQVGGIIGRMATSVWAGLELARQRDSSFMQAAVVGGLTAFVATNVCYELRRGLGKTLNLPDPILALMEDACVLRLIMHIRTARGASICR